MQKKLIANSDKQECWQKKLSKHNAAIKEYKLHVKKEKQKQFLKTNQMLKKAIISFEDENRIAINFSTGPVHGHSTGFRKFHFIYCND